LPPVPLNETRQNEKKGTGQEDYSGGLEIPSALMKEKRKKGNVIVPGSGHCTYRRDGNKEKEASKKRHVVKNFRNAPTPKEGESKVPHNRADRTTGSHRISGRHQGREKCYYRPARKTKGGGKKR